MLVETCSACKQEVRYGTRAGRLGWWHREPVDHNTRFGGPEVHPAESRRMRDAWLLEHGERSVQDEEAHVEPIPEPEVRAHEIEDAELPLSPRRLATAARAAGWDVRATHARGPSLHAEQWTTTGIYDSVLLRFTRGIDHAVAHWRSDKKDKYAFKFGWTWNESGPSLSRVNSTALKAHITQEDPHHG